MPTWDLKKMTEALAKLASNATPTSWIVLTGGPCSGKSTVLAELAKRGHQVNAERALDYIQARGALGESMQEITADLPRFTNRIFELNRLLQDQTPPSAHVIFDRALPDVLAFAIADGLAPDSYLPACAKHTFAAALVFEYVGPRNDATTYHSSGQIRDIEANCEAIYRTLTKRVIRVPAFSTERVQSISMRVDLVEEILQQAMAATQ